MKATLPKEPDSTLPAKAHSFYGDSWAEALGKAAFYLNSKKRKNKSITEPMVRLTHYSPYEKPFTCTLVLPTPSQSNLEHENKVNL